MKLTQNYQKLFDLLQGNLSYTTIQSIKQAAVDYLMSSANANTYSEILSTYIEESHHMVSTLRPLMIVGLQKADLR
ncbi:hypothetical protein ABEW00_17490 [Rossellomorea vietnamensis]|uniref:hypothetical protein n=1 Tax=Rossellomorea vietnamensis TaxID=218284 RepID=UPI003D2A7A68